MYQQMTVQVCEECPTVKYVREGDFVTVDTENGMQDGQVQSKCIIFLPVIYLLWLACCNFFREQQGWTLIFYLLKSKQRQILYELQGIFDSPKTDFEQTTCGD